MPTIQDVKNKMLAYLLNHGEANAATLEKKAECSNKTFLKARQQLEKDGLITKRYEPKPSGGLHAIYSLTQKGTEVAERETTKQAFDKILDNASSEEIHYLKSQFLEFGKRLKFTVYNLKLSGCIETHETVNYIIQNLLNDPKPNIVDLKIVTMWLSKNLDFYGKYLKKMKELYQDLKHHIVSDSPCKLDFDQTQIQLYENTIKIMQLHLEMFQSLIKFQVSGLDTGEFFKEVWKEVTKTGNIYPPIQQLIQEMKEELKIMENLTGEEEEIMEFKYSRPLTEKYFKMEH